MAQAEAWKSACTFPLEMSTCPGSCHEKTLRLASQRNVRCVGGPRGPSQDSSGPARPQQPSPWIPRHRRPLLRSLEPSPDRQTCSLSQRLVRSRKWLLVSAIKSWGSWLCVDANWSGWFWVMALIPKSSDDPAWRGEAAAPRWGVTVGTGGARSEQRVGLRARVGQP